MNTTPALPAKRVPVPAGGSFWRKLLAFTGPGYLIAVGYMDPGNWATDIAGGAQFGYELLFVILLSNVIAILLQHLAVKLGIATGRDLAQMSKGYPAWLRIALWLAAEVMIAACDLAEVIGSAIALNLLFGIPLVAGILITALDVFLLLFLQNKGFRQLEAFVMVLIGTIFACFGVEIFFSRPDMAGLLFGFVPSVSLVADPAMLFIALGIIGATVMPHNLYLHSSLVQTREHPQDRAGKKEAVFFATLDSTFALFLAFFVNAAILVVAAAVFHFSGYSGVSDITQAYRLLSPLLGVGAASAIFAVALLASGQNSTLTGTLAGQVIMEGFLDFHMAPWLRRVITRALAIVPAIIVAIYFGAAGTAKLLILSQVILSVQLPFAVVPLVLHTSSKEVMKEFVNGRLLMLASSAVALLLVILNVWLIWSSVFA